MKFRSILMLFCLLTLSGCVAENQNKLGEVLQSKGATAMNHDYDHVITNLITYKEKLDLRNPKAYSKSTREYIINEIRTSHNTIHMKFNGNDLKTYDDYLRIAFDKNTTIPDRNDFLILGLYKLIWDSYKKGEGHQITTLAYDQAAFRKLYYYLQVIKWKIKTAKDINGKYLFLTWQNNWQVELQNKLLIGQPLNAETLNALTSIKTHKESFLDPSNVNFEIIMSQIIFHVKNSARLIGVEPVDIGIEAMISLVLFL